MSEENEFERTLASIGGKERIYLVSDAAERNDATESDADVLREFIDDLFGDQRPLPTVCAGELSHVCHKGHGDKPSQGTPDDINSGARPNSTQRTIIKQTSCSSRRRTIDCPAIVFFFRQNFISDVGLKEVLKDVRARTKGASSTVPALIGLVRLNAGQSDESRRCVLQLETLIRKVFPQHPSDAVWVGSFIPGTPDNVLDIKKNVCRAIAYSQTADITQDHRNPLLWPFQCLLRSNRGGAANSPPTNKRRGDSGSVDVSIPLKSNAGPNEESVTTDA